MTFAITILLVAIVSGVAFYVLRQMGHKHDAAAQASVPHTTPTEAPEPQPTAETEAQMQAETLQTTNADMFCHFDSSIMERQTATGPIAFDAIVGWFEGLEIREHHIPFMARAQAYSSLIGVQSERPASLFLGLYDTQSSTILKAILVEANEMDAQTADTLGNENLVILE